MNNKNKVVLILLVLIVMLVWLAVFSFPDKKMHLIFCDVGQGDATLITLGFTQVLIDGGPDNKVLSCLVNNMPFWDRTIEIVALTHPEADHLTGLLSVFDKYQVDYFLTGPEGNNSPEYTELKSKLDSLKTKTRLNNPYTGEKIMLGNISLKTLWPEKNFVLQKLRNIGTNENLLSVGSPVLGLQTTGTKLNQFSLVFLLNYKNFNAILMGDADSKVQNDILEVNSLMSLDILKFPHHGSKTGTTEKFISAIKPKEAVISVGKNSFGHPSSEALELLKKYKVKIRRTDLEGEINYQF